MKPSPPRHRVSWLLGLIAIAGIAGWFVPQGLRHEPSTVAAFDPMEDVCIVAPATPWDPASGIARFEPRPIPAEARCPVCGMYPARYPRWAAQVIFQDGATHFFDSPVNLLVFLRRVEHYSTYDESDVVAAFINDVASDTWSAARDAYFVHGSDALGPMREGNLPAFANLEAAQAFAAQRGGQVLRFDTITNEIVDSLVHDAHRHKAHPGHGHHH